MSILVDSHNRVLIQGGTGEYGAAQVAWMRAAGTNVVGYVSPGRGGASIDGVPVFDVAADAATSTGADSVVIYVPAAGVRDAVFEAAEAGLKLAVVAAELVPAHDALHALARSRSKGMWVVGPNTVGITSPSKALLGSIPAEFTMPGPVGLISRSGTMALMISRALTRAGCGQTTVVSIGGDSVIGRAPREYLERFIADDETRLMVYVGEIGGTKEYELLDLIQSGGKPVIAIIIGRSAPAGKRMGHAGALVGGERETAEAKREALREAGAIVVSNIGELVAQTARLAAEVHSPVHRSSIQN